jgi:sulfur carrier protein ThiS
MDIAELTGTNQHWVVVFRNFDAVTKSTINTSYLCPLTL